MQTTLKNTQGQILVSYNTVAHLPYSYVLSNVQESDEEAEANSNLIQESFNVTNETGKTPRQLADENKELLDALMATNRLNLHLHKEGTVGNEVYKIINNALANSTK